MCKKWHTIQVLYFCDPDLGLSLHGLTNKLYFCWLCPEMMQMNQHQSLDEQCSNKRKLNKLKLNKGYKLDGTSSFIHNDDKWCLIISIIIFYFCHCHIVTTAIDEKILATKRKRSSCWKDCRRALEVCNKLYPS